MSDITLLIEGKVFKAKKDVLSQHSDYFRAMFSGNYVENQQEEIKIDASSLPIYLFNLLLFLIPDADIPVFHPQVVDAESMKAILKYMEVGLIDLSDLSLQAIGDLAVSTNFLQITELIKQIEFTLDLQLSLSNWIKTMAIAEMATFAKLEKFAAAFGLLSFPNMQPEYIPSLQRLFWYLSHPYLNIDSELSVFQFGFKWIKKMEQSPDAILIVLGCLDISSVTRTDLEVMATSMKEYEHSLAAKIIDCLLEMSSRPWKMQPANIIEHKQIICEMFTQRVYNEVLSLVKGNMQRQLTLTPIVSISPIDSKADKGPQYLSKFLGQTGFEKWIEVAEKVLWGWSITNWGPNKLVVVGGEYGRGTGLFMRDVNVWDTLRQEWTKHRVQLPPRRHAGVAVIGNNLYVIGGVGTYRLVNV